MENSKFIKELPATTTLSVTDDFIVENNTPVTKRVRWQTMLTAMKTAVSNDLLTLTDTDISNIYAELYE